MSACDLYTLTRCFESKFCLSFPRYLLLYWNVLPFALFCMGKSGHESSNCYTEYLLETFHIQEIVYLNVCPKLCFGRRTTDERRNLSKFNELGFYLTCRAVMSQLLAYIPRSKRICRVDFSYPLIF